MVAQASLGKLSLDGKAIRCALLSLEEPADRIVARLEASGADMAMVDVLGDVETLGDDGETYRRPWRLPEDCSTLERKIDELNAELVVVDGIGYSVTGKGTYQEIAAALSALAGVCERRRVAVLGLTHTRKGDSDAATAAIGSTAWTAIPRVVLVLGADPEDDARRVLQVSPATNYRPPEHGMGFAIANYEPYECGYVADIRESDVTADDLVAWSSPDDTSKLDIAVDFLTGLLAQHDLWVKEVKDATTAAGLSWATVRRAQSKLKIKPFHVGRPDDPEQGWKWGLPKVLNPSEEEVF
jgi:hypothetical protein